MNLRDRYAASAHRLPVQCEHYEPGEDGRRCVHYLANGACARPDEFMCVEWLRANGHPAPVVTARAESLAASPVTLAVASVAVADEAPRASTPRDLFGRPVVPPVERARPPVAAAASAVPTHALLPALTEADVASFRALGAEVAFDVPEVGEIWLVAEYRDADRREIRLDHAAMLASLCAALPGSRIAAFARPGDRAVVAAPTPAEATR